MSTVGQPERATQNRDLALFQLKQGLMQELFTGRIRLV